MEFVIPVHRFIGNLVTETEDDVQALGSSCSGKAVFDVRVLCEVHWFRI